MEMSFDFPGGTRMDAPPGPSTARTDQVSRRGGQGSASKPLATFLASIGTCAGIDVFDFCHQRGLPAKGSRLIKRLEVDPFTPLVGKAIRDLPLLPDFLDKYQAAVVRAAEQAR